MNLVLFHVYMEEKCSVTLDVQSLAQDIGIKV